MLRWWWVSFYSGLRDFVLARREKTWALLLALLALGAFFLAPSLLSPSSASSLPALPESGVRFGASPPTHAVVVWWECPACERFLGLMRERGGPEAFAPGVGLLLYTLDKSGEDYRRTVSYLCASRGGGAWELLFARRLPSPSPECEAWAREVRQEWDTFLSQARVAWTPALFRRRRGRGSSSPPTPPSTRSSSRNSSCR